MLVAIDIINHSSTSGDRLSLMVWLLTSSLIRKAAGLTIAVLALFGRRLDFRCRRDRPAGFAQTISAAGADIRAVMRLGSSLGMITTAEGVETEQQLEILRAEGCMQAQGYLFSRPKPVAEIPAMLKKIRPRVRAA